MILVVEDNPAAAEILARHLEAGGFRMKIARTGNEALTMARELKPVAITLDILLPEIDGWEVLRRLKADDADLEHPGGRGQRERQPRAWSRTWRH